MIKKFITYSIFATVCVVAYAQEEVRVLTPFSQISVSQGISVSIKKGSDLKAVVDVSGSNIDLEEVITEVFGDRLSVRFEKNMRRVNGKVTVVVTYQSLSEIDISSAGRLTSLDLLTTENLEIDVSSAGKVNLQISTEVLDVDVSSAGKVVLRGNAAEQVIDVSSAGDYDAHDLISEIVDIDVSSAGSVILKVNNELKANASSAGSIKYRGEPLKVNVHSSSGGSIKKY